MDVVKFIKDCFEEHGRILLDELIKAGFSVNQAIDFLPEIAFDIANATRVADQSEKVDAQHLNQSCMHFNAVNLQAVEQKTGLQHELVETGYHIVSPFFMSAFKKIH